MKMSVTNIRLVRSNIVNAHLNSKHSETLILTTLKVESFAGRNFRDFANFSVVRESLYPRNRNFQVVRESLYPRNFLKFLKN